MKLKELAKEFDLKPVELIQMLEVEIAPRCSALTDLNDEQVKKARALFSEPSEIAPEGSAPEAITLASLEATLAGQIVDDQRNQLMVQKAGELVSLYVNNDQLPDAKKHPKLCAFVEYLGNRQKKHPRPLGGGNVTELAAQVEVIEGKVILPIIELPQVSMAAVEPESLEGSPESYLKSAAVPTLPSSDSKK